MADEEFVSNVENTEQNATLDSQPLTPTGVVKDLHEDKNEGKSVASTCEEVQVGNEKVESQNTTTVMDEKPSSPETKVKEACETPLMESQVMEPCETALMESQVVEACDTSKTEPSEIIESNIVSSEVEVSKNLPETEEAHSETSSALEKLETPSHQVSNISIENDIEKNVIKICEDIKEKGDENDMEVETHEEAKEIQVEQTASDCVEKVDIQQSVIEIDDEIGECNKNKSEKNEDMEMDIPEEKKEIETQKPLMENSIIEQIPSSDENDNKDSVIELDDDLAEGNKVRTDESDVEVTMEKSATDIPIIEIDDDEDDDEPKTDATVVNKDQDKPKIAEADETNTSMEVDQAIKAAEAVLEAIKSNDDLEMEEISEEPNKTLLKETSARAESPTEPDSDDSTEEIYYDQECINYECPRNHKQFFIAPQFTLSFYKAKKRRSQKQYVCSACYDTALESYEEYATLLKSHQPLLLTGSKRNQPEYVEITDSSEEEEEEVTDRQSTDKGSFSKADLELLEAELENTVKKVLEDVGIQNQLTWSRTLLMARAKKLEEESDKNNEMLRSLQQKADKLHESLYQSFKIKTRHFHPLDLNTGMPYFLPEVSEASKQSAYPPSGEVIRPPIQVGQTYFSPKAKTIGSWMPCRVEQIEPPQGVQKVTHYKVKFCNSPASKYVTAKQLAYYNPPLVRLPIGSRVLAYFDGMTGKVSNQSAFYPGIIAEQLKQNNKNRYLIFYDDGYTQYVSHKHVRLVCQVSENVWEDVDTVSRDFIQKYLTQYSINRPMVQTQKGQSMTTESNGKWIYARVVDIDCSLIQMQFEGAKNHTEWIYRGSLRLGPVFKEYQKTMQKDTIPMPRVARRTEPFIRYTDDEEAAAQAQEQSSTASNEARAVAKKSISRTESNSPAPVPTVRHLNNSTIYLEDENKPKGKVVYYTAKRDLPPTTYKIHSCDPSCLFKIQHNLSAYSPLSKPLLSGWERLLMKMKSKRIVAYRGPCGRIMRDLKEVHRYLRLTENILNVDNFDFHSETNCLAEYVIEQAIVQKRDISGGQEKMAIPLVNYYDNTLPPECKYAAQRIPTEGVNLNLDPEFLVGCDCKDDCSDKSKCSCWQLTYAGAKYGNPNTPVEEIGYQYKRLYEHVPTGIYECNSRCKCKSRCLNRVVQEPLQMKLQVFKTSNRGWGLRCINDVPKGSFVCIYAGHLLTEAKANEGGLDAGDEYFAELDYIEVAEQIKEGYESDVEPMEPEEEEEVVNLQDNYAPDPEDDDEFTPSKSFLTRARNRANKLARNNDDDTEERRVINFDPNADMNESSSRESSMRTLFGKDETCYIMDAKTIGNLGRYFNHSCSPNLFVQNVFVDTHDLRFPWVAFFAMSNIRAGTELTWNYNYEVGVVPGKVLYCQCGAPNCRLRLL